MNTTSMLPVGFVLHGKYQIERHLASGGFGNTYKATNTANGRTVAIKEFFMKGVTERDETTSGVNVSNIDNYEKFSQQKSKFRKEAQRLMMFHDQHIVSVHEAFEENGTAYYVMDFIDGESLADRMKRTGKPFTEQEVDDMLPQILDALKTVHNEGLWHLDLKPGNIMIDHSERITLIDFGASKQFDAVTGGATAKTKQSFTDGYAPHEQMEENYSKYGPWTDIYALGATLYALLTKNRPPRLSDIAEDNTSDKHEALPFPNGVSDKMRSLILWMMSFSRKQRPQSVYEVQNSSFYRSRREDFTRGRDETIQESASEQEATVFASASRTTNRDEMRYDSRPADNGNSKGYTSSSYSTDYRNNSEDGSNNTLITVALFVGALIVCAVVYMAINANNSSSSNTLSYYNSYFGVGTYEGDIKNGQPNGYGTVKYNNGAMFYGYFVNGQPHGHGTLKDATGETVYDGEYVYGERKVADNTSSLSSGDTKAVYYDPLGSGTYKGEMKDGEPHGRGTIVYDSGETFTGYFRNGEPNGHGTLISSTGEVLYDGIYENGRRKVEENVDQTSNNSTSTDVSVETKYYGYIKPEGGYTNIRNAPNGDVIYQIKDGTDILYDVYNSSWYIVYDMTGRRLGYVHSSKIIDY